MKKLTLFLTLFMLLSLTTNAQFCNKYADKAVAQYKLAKKNNLPDINWPMWTDDWNGHYNWCKTVTEDVANKENEKRQAYLDKYIKPATLNNKENFCNAYADKAIAQFSQAKQLFKPQGDLWSDNRESIYNWCMKVPKDVTNNQQAIRQAHIDEFTDADQHTQTPPVTKTNGNTTVTWSGVIPETQDVNNLSLQQLKEKTCKHYAEESVKQNKLNSSKGCGLGNEPDWSSDYNGHYNWCMHGNNYTLAENNLKSRNKKLANCSKSASVAMAKIGGRSAFGTTMATTYMDMHNMFVPHKNNCSSSEAFVPLWKGAELGFCIDKNYHSHPLKKCFWSDAIRICLSENKRLPEIWELKVACQNATSLGIHKMQFLEWASNFPVQWVTTYTGDSMDPGPFTISGMAVPVFGYDCSYISMGFIGGLDTGSDKSFSTKVHFRCLH